MAFGGFGGTGHSSQTAAPPPPPGAIGSTLPGGYYISPSLFAAPPPPASMAMSIPTPAPAPRTNTPYSPAGFNWNMPNIPPNTSPFAQPTKTQTQQATPMPQYQPTEGPGGGMALYQSPDTPPQGYRPSSQAPQFFQPIYRPQYQNYNMGNPYGVSMYGQSPFMGGMGFNPYGGMGFNPYGGFGGYGMKEGGIASLIEK